MKREKQPFSLVKGCRIEFENGGHLIRFFGSALTGLEKVYVDGILAASRRSFRRKSTILFKINEVNFSISTKVHNLLNGSLTCTLLREGIPIAKKRLIVPATFLVEYILLAYVSIIIVLGIIKGHFSPLRLYSAAVLGVLFSLFYIVRKIRGLKPCLEETNCFEKPEAVIPEPGQAAESEYNAPPEKGWKSLFKGFLKNLKTGFRAVIFLKVDASQFAVSEKQLLVLIGINLALIFIMNFIDIGMNGELYLYYLPGTFFYLPLMIIASYWIAVLESKSALKLSIPVALISAGLWIETAGNLAGFALKETRLDGLSFIFGYRHYYRLFGWWLLSSCLLVFRLAHPMRKPLQAGFVFLLILAVPFWFIPKWNLWGPAYDEENEPPKITIANEEIFYQQPALFEKSLSAIKKGRRGIIDLYFVGFGADASQNVFMNEIVVVKKLFDERFDTKGRSIALINNDETVETTPIASRTSLIKSIDRIAMCMNKEEDVLFLYLTSHGSKTHSLSVEYWPLRLAEIRPQDIKNILDKAGITWKVIAISACYSGGFIDQLKDENTLMITSADADNASLGCGNESDFTFFGKAYFDNALRKNFSFIAPFNEVKNEILKRELDMSETPSNPQIHIGTKIQKQLEKLESRLRESYDSMR